MGDRVLEISSALTRIMGAIHTAATPAQALASAVDGIRAMLGAELGYVVEPELEGSPGMLRAAGILSAEPSLLDDQGAEDIAELRFAPGEGAAGKVERDPVWLSDLGAEQVYSLLPRLPSGAWCSALAVPILARGGLRAVLEVVSSERLRDDELTLSALLTISRQIGLIYEREHVRVRLIEAREAAEKSDRAKTRFVENISHEIRTPLTSILGQAQLLQSRDDLGDDVRKRLASISACAEQLHDILENMLKISTLGADQSPLRMRKFSIEHTLRELADWYGPTARERNLELHFECPTGPDSWIRSDETKIREVVDQLISNALKFTQKGSILLSARIHVQESAGRVLEIAVEDTGVGVPTTLRTTMFQAFENDPDSASTGRGAGLGLTVARVVTETLGGHLNVQANAFGGTTFTLTLEVEDATTPSLPGLPPRPPRVLGMTSDSPRREVLIVGSRHAQEVELERSLAELGVTAVLESVARGGHKLDETWDVVVLLASNVPANWEQRLIAMRDQNPKLQVLALREQPAAVLQCCDETLPEGSDIESWTELVENALGGRVVRRKNPVPALRAVPPSQARVPPCRVPVPGVMREAVHRAAKLADRRTLQALAQQVSAIDAPTAVRLMGWIEMYQYEEILQWSGVTSTSAAPASSEESHE